MPGADRNVTATSTEDAAAEAAQAAEDDAFRAEARAFLEAHASLRQGFGDTTITLGATDTSKEAETAHVERCRAWQRTLFDNGWAGIAWPTEYGGRGGTLRQARIFAQEESRFDASASVFAVAIQMVGPTIMAHGTDDQKSYFLTRMLRGDDIWCQLFSEPGAGSDLAGLTTRAERDGDEWIVNGQKVWTSLAHVSHWCFVVARTDPESSRHKGLSFLLVPMDQPGVEVRPIVQPTGGGEFNEVFFDDARTEASLVVGDVDDGWRVAMGLLGFERGVSTLAQQVGFERELDHVFELASAHGRGADPVLRARLVDAWIGLRLMKWNAMRSMAAKGVPGPEASISKLFWATWHRDLGELMIDVMGPDGLIGESLPYELTLEQKLFLFSRSDTIYGGSNEIQRNVLGERVLGLPKEAK
jgi:alkylation response protein AidB-like acyl-CoA dehydrogenase